MLQKPTAVRYGAGRKALHNAKWRGRTLTVDVACPSMVNTYRCRDRLSPRSGRVKLLLRVEREEFQGNPGCAKVTVLNYRNKNCKFSLKMPEVKHLSAKRARRTGTRNTVRGVLGVMDADAAAAA